MTIKRQNADPSNTTGLILAGGQAIRMGGIDKGLQTFQGKFFIHHVIERLKPQVSSLIINANRNATDYAQLGHPLVSDSIPGYQGPLAGIASGIRQTDSAWVATCPCDSPLLPEDLVQRLSQACNDSQADIAIASSAGRLQPVFLLLRTSLIDSLIEYLEQGERKIDRWVKQQHWVEVEFQNQEAFINLNTLEDIQSLEQQFTSR